MKLEDTYLDRNLEAELLETSKDVYKEKTEPGLFLANQIGNMYSASVYGGLISYLTR